MKKKYLLTIPSNVKMLYFPKKHTAIFTGLFKTESLKLRVKFFLRKNVILITKKNSFGVQNDIKKALKSDQITTIALMRQKFLNISSIIYSKLILVGVGYRILSIENFILSNKLFLFKLGYSHLLYFHVPEKINFFCLKLTTFFIYSNSYLNLTKISSTIQSYKKPEPYKGKGILYSGEKIILKEGKKI